MKPGIRTSEFWVSVAVVLMGAAATAFSSSPFAQIAGSLAAALAAAGYAFPRTSAKAAVEASELEVQRVETEYRREQADRAARYSMQGGEDGRARVRTLLSIAVLGLVCLGCLGPSARAGYVAADRQTFEAISPEHEEYVDQDDTLSEEQKQLRRDALTAWELRIQAEEKALQEGR